MAEVLSRTRAQISARTFALPAVVAMSYMMSKLPLPMPRPGGESYRLAHTCTHLDNIWPEGVLEAIADFFARLEKWSDDTPTTIEAHLQAPRAQADAARPAYKRAFDDRLAVFTGN